MSDTPAPRFTLRQLPLPAKLVLSTFLLAVGVGYTSAMVQLHMQHGDRDGKPLPTVENVIAVFAGKVWKNPGDVADTPSKLEQVVSGDPHGEEIVGSNMTPAFFAADASDYAKLATDDKSREKTNRERTGERDALVLWAKSAPEARQVAYDTDRFQLPKDKETLVVTPAFTDKANPGTVLVKSILFSRCVRCHTPGGEKGDIPLRTYAEVATLLPTAVAIPPGGGYVDSGRQIGLEKLTQSTHAHLLSFAVLFTCTGLVFAFTGLPGFVRGTVGPIVLVAQVADISCWWLARLPEPYGPAFAMAIMGTGGVVGLGLAAHITFGLFGMYGSKGRTVLALLAGLAAGGAGVLWTTKIDPYLKDEKAKAEQKVADEQRRRDDDTQKAAKADGGKKVVPSLTGPSQLERVVTGPWKGAKWVADGKVPDGGMVAAFFEREPDFKRALKDDPAEVEKLVPQREGERDGFLAWVKAAPDARKKAYDDNAFALPEATVGKPSPEFTDPDGKRLKVRDLIEARCVRCHEEGHKVPLATFDQLSKYFAPRAKE